MDGRTLMAAMEYPGYPAPLPLSRYQALADDCDRALIEAGCTNVERVAMFLAQIGAESGSLRWTEELASGEAYNGRFDLGNTQPGDGPRFKGRSLIQITGRMHYANLSAWAFRERIPGVTRPDFFVLRPSQLAADQYAFLGPVWYWRVARPQMNQLADARDIDGATYAVNGGYNNLAGRTERWHKCLSLGAAILPAAQGVPTMMAYKVTFSPTSTRFFILQDGAPVHHVAPDYARNIAAMCGRPIAGISPTMHERIVANQAHAAKGK